MTDNQPPAELIMPFVVVASQSGPFEDSAFVAGCQYGAAEVRLRMAVHMGWLPYPSVVVMRELVPQFDLLAMHLGVAMIDQWPDSVEVSDDQAAEWAHLSFQPIEESDDDQ